MGRSMAAVLEAVGSPAIEAAEADLQFEAEALVAWEDYELTGNHVSAETVEALFGEALARARTIAEKQRG